MKDWQPTPEQRAAAKADLPAHVRADVQRILDTEARRRLADELDRQPLDASRAARPRRRDADRLHYRSHEVAADV